MKIVAKITLVVSVTMSMAMGLPNVAMAADSVVAVVNDGILTASQVQMQCEVQAKINGVVIEEKMRRGFCRRVLVQMIDAELIRQYAAQVGIGFDKRELDKLRPEVLTKLGVSAAEAKKSGLLEVIDEMLAGELRQQLVMRRAVEPRVNVSTAEIDKLLSDMAKQRQVLEREISQIVMKPADDDAAVQARMRVVAARLAAGESFEALAKELSEDEFAKVGGRMGWFASGQLNPLLEDTLDTLTPGQVSELIRTPLGWHLIRLDNVRRSVPIGTDPVPQVQLLLVNGAKKADAKAVQAAMRAVRKAKDGLAEAKAQDGLVVKELGWVNRADLQPAVKQAVEQLKTGRWSEVFDLNGAPALVYVAGSQTIMPPDLNTYRDKVYKYQFANQMELESRKFLRDLRARAFVDIRY